MIKVTLNRNDVEFIVEIEPEDEGPESWMDDEHVPAIREAMEWNEWAWCQVTVRALLDEPVRFGERQFCGFASLCGCSYDSLEDFKASDYYSDLCDEAFNDLEMIIKHTCEQLEKNGTISLT